MGELTTGTPMSTNFTSDALSDARIVEHAYRLRRHHGLGEHDVPDVVALLERDTIPTRFGMKAFTYKMVADEELWVDGAITLVSPTTVRIRVSRSTMERASSLDRRARMTIAHEMMHGVLHRIEAPLARARVETRSRIIAPHVSVERQASVGASAYLVTEPMLRASTSPEDLARRALVSFAAADLRWEEHQNLLNRGEVQAGLRALSNELKALAKPMAATRGALRCPEVRRAIPPADRRAIHVRRHLRPHLQ